jgi:hypothetical protein
LVVAAIAVATVPFVALAQCGAHKDFLVRSDTTLAPVRPADCATVEQTPPEFTWPPVNGRNLVYTLALKLPDGRVETRTTTKNWLLWDAALPPGTYSWTLKVFGSERDTSEARRFTIAREAIAFVVPGAEAMLKRARATTRPRTWPADATGPLAAVKAERAKALHQLLAEVDDDTKKSVMAEPHSGSQGANYDDSVTEQKRALAAAFAWAATHNRHYGADGENRLLALAAWNPLGATGYKTNDMASRTVAWTLALGYDWMHDYLGEAAKAALVRAIRARTQPMFDDIMSRISQYPYDSHGNITLNIVAAIGLLMAGDIPEADTWVKEALPAAIAWTSPWGWEDGGFANGTTQGFWDAGSNLPAWLVYRNAAGVDLAKKDWVRNHIRYFAYFVPPGSPAGVFGDGQELAIPELWARIGKALNAFAPSPLGRWYAKRMTGEDAARIELLVVPRFDLGNAPFPAGTPNAALFPSIGWAALHSDLADPERTSIYFKSSPYGSYNHSHADQLSFVIHARGRRLAFASGDYDGYRTPHWTNWYKQTRAANALTFDGGKGQGLDERGFSGEITRFETHAQYDVVSGHAEKAYAGALTRAARDVIYVRPGTVIVRDRLASASPRTWEWNIHAANRMTKVSERRIALRDGPAQMCVEMAAGPEVAFTQSDRFLPPPSGSGVRDEWHGTFATTTRSAQAEFVTVMRVGSDCGGAAAEASRAGDGWRVSVDGRIVELSEERIGVK